MTSGEEDHFLDAEIGNAEIHVDIGRVRGGTDIRRPVPGRLHHKSFGQRRHFARVGDAADMPQVAANVVNQLFLNQVHAIPERVEKFTHGEGRGGVLANQAEALLVFRAQRVFQEEEMVGLEFMRQARGLHGAKLFVTVVHQFDFFPQLGAQVVKEPGYHAQIRRRLEEFDLRQCRPDAGRRAVISASMSSSGREP